MSRVASPVQDDRSTKRSRKSVESEEMADIPDHIADIVGDGDAILVLGGGLSTAPDTPIGLRVSSHALSLASPVLKAGLSNSQARINDASSEGGTADVLLLPEEDGDAMFILCNILHLQNDKLPASILPDLLCRIAVLASKYECTVAAGRATLQWFDRLYTSKTPGDVWPIVEAAFLLNEAMFFARFSSRWVLESSLHLWQVPVANTMESQKLSVMLSQRHCQCTIILRNDLDALVDTCVRVYSKKYAHYIDWAPTMSPEPDETPTGEAATNCRVDPDGAATYLGALRDADIWPQAVWVRPNATGGKGDTIGSVVRKLAAFREPEYDGSDKCEFCEDVKILFTEKLDTLKDVQKDRLWGLCLDCYQAGGLNAGECRYEHVKPQRAQMGG